MQTFEYFEEPCPHLIIDEFLSPLSAKDCLQESIDLEPLYEDSKVTDDDQYLRHAKECEQCRKDLLFNRHNIRKNDVVYLDGKFNNQIDKSIIMKNICISLTSNWFMNSMINKGVFEMINYTNSIEFILSRYGTCDFYGWHNDNGSHNISHRKITLCYYMNNENEKFTGGELILTGKDIHDRKIIKPKHNRAVFFMSDRTHSVNTVKLEGDKFEDGRFSLNVWLGFSGKNLRYR